MKVYLYRSIPITLAIGMAMLFLIAFPLFAGTLPNSVQFKVDKCIEALNEAETELNARNPHMAREPLRVAKERLNSIKEYQSESWDHLDVVAVRNRYDALETRYNDAQNKEAASAGTAEEQLKRLEKFRQFSPEATYPEDLVASQSTYRAAKALVEEILAAGADVQLQGYSDYSMTKLNVEVWERNRDQVIQNFIGTAKEYTQKNTSREQDWLDRVDQRLLDLAKLMPANDPKLVEAQSTADKMRKFIRQEQLEKAAKVFMSSEKFKGKGGDSLRELARKAVMSKFPEANILKIKLINSAWGAPEGGAQWTDNTYTAVEVRTTSYFAVEVASKQGEDVFLHRVYLYKAKINGAMQAAKSYVVGSQMMLEKNVR